MFEDNKYNANSTPESNLSADNQVQAEPQTQAGSQVHAESQVEAESQTQASHMNAQETAASQPHADNSASATSGAAQSGYSAPHSGVHQGPDQNGAYRYSWTPKWERDQQTNQSNPTSGNQAFSGYNFQATPPKPTKKNGASRAVALVLCCALVGGGAGVGGAVLYNSLGGNSNATTIYQNSTQGTQVNVQQADGVKEMTLEEIYASYADSCVNITCQVTVQQGWQQYTGTSSGSGFILSADGYIVTNYHVIDGANAIKVTLNNGQEYDATLIGGEETNDVAVLKVKDVTGLKPVVLGDSDTLVVGQQVSTIGNALGALSFSQTSGHVSGVGRSVTMSDGTIINMIQTDCVINSGNSGGPLFDQYGRVVGITSAKYSNNGDSSSASIEGIGFAIPINDVIDMIQDFIQYGYVTGRPSMGITAVEVTEDYAKAFGWPSGVYVNGVNEGSCSQTAGLKQGDIITKLGDTAVTTVAELNAAKNQFKAGESTTLEVYRSGETITLNITFDEEQNNTQDSQSQQQDPAPQQTSSTQQGGGYFDPWDFYFGN